MFKRSEKESRASNESLISFLSGTVIRHRGNFHTVELHNERRYSRGSNVYDLMVLARTCYLDVRAFSRVLYQRAIVENEIREIAATRRHKSARVSRFRRR